MSHDHQKPANKNHTVSTWPKCTQLLYGHSAIPPTQELTSCGRGNSTSSQPHQQHPFIAFPPVLQCNKSHSCSLTWPRLWPPATPPESASRGSKVTPDHGHDHLPAPPYPLCTSKVEHLIGRACPPGSNKTRINAHKHTTHRAWSMPTSLIEHKWLFFPATDTLSRKKMSG